MTTDQLRASDVSDASAAAVGAEPRKGRRRRWGRIIASSTGALLVALLLTPTGCYLSRAGWEEAKILAGRRRIVRIVDDASTDPATRARLQLVLAGARLRRGLDQAAHRGKLHHLFTPRAGYARAGGLRRVPRSARAVHLVVPHCRPRPVQGLLRLLGGAESRPRPRAPRATTPTCARRRHSAR